MSALFKNFKMLTIVVLLVIAIVAGFVELGAASVTPWLALAALAALVQYNRGGAKCQNFLVWSDEYSVGIKAMDADHKRLLNLINNLKAGMLCNTGEEFERHNLEELVSYTRTHLANEEALLKEHGYPDYEGHKAQHDQMVSYVESFVRKYNDKGSAILPEIADYLTLWLTQHINVTDKKYSEHLQQRGVE